MKEHRVQEFEIDATVVLAFRICSKSEQQKCQNLVVLFAQNRKKEILIEIKRD